MGYSPDSDDGAIGVKEGGMKNEIEKSSDSNGKGRTPTNEEIARRAYEIWQRDGCPDGCEQAHWYQAERELAKGSGPAAKPAPAQKKDARPAGSTPIRRFGEVSAGSPIGRQ